ncbi:hypothetical protein RN51_01347 [Microbacterium oxydans]|uniref:Uncharacterized protein n=1 Tax=Microbacterium oxydans TaxID=82380 RepID=A0A0F0KX50_9MICO|nr:hypothetical protein [Microbacterium oxydans]KJL23811.1 hypothetical protein RN51_01347 [Microbacterium oxydans]
MLDLDWTKIGTAALDWVPWLIAILGAALGVLGYRRARRAEKRETAGYNAPPWGDAVHDSGDLFTIKNASTRDVVVTQVIAEPAEKQNLLEFRHGFPHTIYAGDSLGILARARYSLSRPGVILEWHFADDDTARRNRRILPAPPS